MGFEDIKKKAKDALGQHSDKVEGGIDKVSQFAKDRFGHEDKIDSATEKAKGYLGQDDTGQDNTDKR
ncbi:MAG: antitoxin [Pseudonocardiaceae bacterium]|nr:antitoxin [Pseudonocardiaceae bacterium]